MGLPVCFGNQAELTSQQVITVDHDNIRHRTSVSGDPENDIYFGPTSQLYVSSPSDQVDVAAPSDVSCFEPAVNIDSDPLHALLLQSYWKYQTLSVRVIDEELFMDHRRSKVRSQYYSRFLESALLACSTRHSTSEVVRRLGLQYAYRAKAELVSELEQPKISTLQGLLLLSDFEMAGGHDRVGWIYCGMN
jgi:hypothetical protein